jgi:pimeloyl-ACP methyl ester carboxylesterase/heme-degrading monooxygenase HmoA
MKIKLLCLTIFISSVLKLYAQQSINMMNFDTIKIQSHIKNLKVALLHMQPKTVVGNTPILFIHGSSFPSALAAGFRMNSYSWMDFLSDHNYESYALDFLGYGNSDRYPEMTGEKNVGQPVGRALDVYKDIDSAVNYIIAKSGHHKIILIGHSWGGMVSGIYATKFPDKIEKLVLFSAITPRANSAKLEKVNTFYESMTPAVRVENMRNLTPGDNACQLEPEIYGKWQNEWLLSDHLQKSSKEKEIRFPAGPEQDINDLDFNQQFYDPAKIISPTLLIRGEWDSHPSNEDEGRLFSRLVNTSNKKYVVIEKGTHVMHLEKSRTQLYDEVLNFIAGQPLIPGSKHAIAVIFEVIPGDGKKQEYLDIAARLKPELEKIDGFISIERFQSIYNPGKILSLSFWRDEDAIKRWRNLELHRDAQAKGREYIFKDYHLRIADVVRDYGMFDRNEAPADSKKFHVKTK